MENFYFGTTLFLFYSMLLLSSVVIESRVMEGTEFVLGFMQHDTPAEETARILIVNSPENDSPATVAITSPSLSGSNIQSEIIEKGKTIDLPRSVVHQNSEQTNKGVLVVSDKPIMVYGFAGKEGWSVDGYLTLPIPFLGTEYIVLNYPPGDYQAELLVVGAKPGDTTVEITFTAGAQLGKSNYEAGQKNTFTLDKQETLFFRTRGDITGTKIVSDQPVAVFSGSQCANIPKGMKFCDHLASQLLPVDSWGQTFLTSPLATRKAGDIFRIVASESNTKVVINKDDTRTLATEGAFIDIEVKSGDQALLVADKPVQVAQFSKGQKADDIKADPFMMILPSIRHAASGTFALSPINIETKGSEHSSRHFINIITECQGKEAAQITPPPVKEQIDWLEQAPVQPEGGPAICAGTAELTYESNVYAISHKQPFQILVYSLGYHVGFGYPLFMNISTGCELGPCGEQGICEDLDIGRFKCECNSGFTGERCEIEVNECESLPCQNGGTCKDLKNGYGCVCDNKHAGLRCEQRVSDCYSDPCQNGGKCVGLEMSGYVCICLGKFEGERCEVPVNPDPCLAEPCFNRGTCVADPSTELAYRCQCQSRFVGKRCEARKNYCNSASCANKGTCLEKADGYFCFCAPGFSGDDCRDRAQKQNTTSTCTCTNSPQTAEPSSQIGGDNGYDDKVVMKQPLWVIGVCVITVMLSVVLAVVATFFLPRVKTALKYDSINKNGLRQNAEKVDVDDRLPLSWSKSDDL